MQLSKQLLQQINGTPGLSVPPEHIFSLPEKVLQFGTGVLLRGLPDYFIDAANRKGLFNGRVIVVKSTDHGDTDAFSRQDGLYTLYIKGVVDGEKKEETIINSSISRVLSAKTDWEKILEAAHNAQLQVIISNTTEVGITLTQDDVHARPPHSFPGKLLAFLHERYKAFRGSDESGMVIIPTELITDNGSKLKAIVLELARMNKMDTVFIQWLEKANHFCNSLVDRIVPGKLKGPDQERAEKEFGYTDELAIMAESFRLWAIESDDAKVKQALSFSQADEGVVISPHIEKFRELKLRLLNGTHTFSCGIAALAGFTTVKEALNNEVFTSYVHQLMTQEIATAVSSPVISYTEAINFANKVMDRFRNPYLEHAWSSITVQYASKMKMRNVPLLLWHYKNTNEPPRMMALGFAAFILYMKTEKRGNGYVGQANGKEYTVQDDHAGYFSERWKQAGEKKVVDSILSDKEFWGTDLAALPGFAGQVKKDMESLLQKGILESLRETESVNDV